MPDTLAPLEEQRAKIVREISELGDFRSGSITTIRGRCGKPACHCHRPNHPGHGPHVRLTRKVEGKTVSETFPTPAALRKAQCEVAAFQRFRALSQELLQVNEQICGLRPVEETLTPEGKKRRRRSSRRSREK
jgi:hypothetical protein